MTEEQYLNERLEDQIKWYNQRSGWNQRWYKILKRIELILSASIPVAIALGTENFWVKLSIAAAGSVIAIITGIHGLYNFQENWIQFRATCETLKHEKYLFLTKAGVYAEAQDPFRLLVERAESVISRENINWEQINKSLSRQNHCDSTGSPQSSTGS